MAELVFYCGTMNSGKSTLALQTNFNFTSNGMTGLLFSKYVRQGKAVLSSGLGLSADAICVDNDMNFFTYVTESFRTGKIVDYIICDETQFYSTEQIDQLAQIVDDLDIDVYAFGITVDFRMKLFSASKRLLELADRIVRVQVPTLCWCGARATHNARLVDGVMVVTGEQIVPKNTDADSLTEATKINENEPTIVYEVLCRKHHRLKMTSHNATAEHISRRPLPFDE